jgi:Protein of unknown function (DUF3800)
MGSSVTRSIIESNRLWQFMAEGPSSNIIMLSVFFDESGKLADTDYVVFAGAVGFDEQWSVMAQKWAITIAQRGLTHISMKEAIRLEGPFAKWAGREVERDDLLVSLINIATPIIGFYVVASVSSLAFRSLPVEQSRKLKNPQYCGFEACLKQTLTKSKGPINSWCDSSEEYAVECLKLYAQLRRKDAEFKQRCVSIRFAEDQVFPPLQLADVVAYCARQKVSGNTPLPVVQRILDIIDNQAQTNNMTYLRDGAGLGSGILGE